jgi:hypothetical protein
MPESWGSASPGASPRYAEVFYGDIIMEEGRESVYDEEGDESRLVRNASLGKRGKPALVMNKGLGNDLRPSPTPVQSDPFSNGTGFVELSSSSSGALPTVKATAGPGKSPDGLLPPPNAWDAGDESRKMTQSPRSYSRLSAIRRPPKMDMDPGNNAQSRASMTSLPDLIRRATRLAAMMDRGRRPASRFEQDFDFPDEKAGVRDSSFNSSRFPELRDASIMVLY